MVINKQVLTALRKVGVKGEGVLYLLALYHELSVSCIPDLVQKRVNVAGIFERDFHENGFNINWLMPLYEGTAIPLSEWEWVNDWRALFKRVNPDRSGTKAYCITRMKKFFSKFPSLRQDDVMKATTAYLKTVSEPIYCKNAHKFIFEGSGTTEYSQLYEWCENTRERKQSNHSFKKMSD